MSQQIQETKKDNMSHLKNAHQHEQYARLPCRGCVASCKNYHRCQGKLWRLQP